MFTGVFCPSITPLHEDGTIDYPAWERHLEFLIESRISGVLIFGSIGEFFSFSTEEKEDALAFAAKTVGGRTKLFAGTGSTRIEETLRLNSLSAELGYDAVVVVSPYYFGPSDAQARQFFSEVAEKSPIPVLLYNFPERTGTDLHADMVASIAADSANVVGIKDTVDSAAHTRRTIAATAEDFSVLSGFDEYYLDNRMAGGNGILSGLTNVVPEIFVRMHEAYESGDFAGAIRQARKISGLMALYEIGDHFIPTIKAATALRRGTEISSSTREPSLPLTSSDSRRIHVLLEKYAATS